MKDNLIITISREYGSGGREIGELLAHTLNIPYYDRKIIDLAAKETGFDVDFIANEEQRITNSFLFNFVTSGYMLGNISDTGMQTLTDQVFAAESEIIEKVAAEGACVVVGRCADVVLKGKYPTFNIFIHADIDTRCTRIMREYGIDKEKALDDMKRIDKARIKHYQYYTNQKWGSARNYDITLNSAKFGVEKCADILRNMVEKF